MANNNINTIEKVKEILKGMKFNFNAVSNELLEKSIKTYLKGTEKMNCSFNVTYFEFIINDAFKRGER